MPDGEREFWNSRCRKGKDDFWMEDRGRLRLGKVMLDDGRIADSG